MFACLNQTHIRMKKAIVSVSFATLLAAVTGCIYISVAGPVSVSDRDMKATATANQKGDIPAEFKKLEVDNSFGLVHIVGVETGPAEWNWKLTVRATTDALAKEYAQSATCKAEGDKDKLRIVVSFPDTKGKAQFTSDIEVRVPKSVAIEAKNRYGQTQISDIGADVEASNQSGGIEIRNVGGMVRANNAYATLKVSNCGAATLKNQSGSVEAINIRGALDANTQYASLVARDVAGSVKLRNQSGMIDLSRSEGDVDARTSYAELKVKDIKGSAVLSDQSGSIKANGITGTLKATTSYAAIEIERVKGASIVCNNQSGSIRVHASSAITNLEAKTSYALAEVHLPADLKPAIQARTSYAEIDSDFPILIKSADKDALADVPAGTPRVNVQNQSGKIRIVRN